MDESRASNLRDLSILSSDPMSGADTISGMTGTNTSGEQLFVINLCAAMTPINLDGQAIAGLDQYKLYQVSRMEDGRRRYRLRLGFFTTEADAEDVLSSVRDRYATAFTSCLVEEDLKHATGYLKCSVQDLERTGRYAVQKLRGDSGATTTIRALDAKAIQHLQASTVHVDAPKATVSPIRTQTAHPPVKISPVVEASWSPEKAVATQKIIAAKALAKASSAPSVTRPVPASTMTTPHAEAPKRESLMRRAHAMAPMDAVERAKALPGAAVTARIDAVTTGKFKLPMAPTPAATPQIAVPTAAVNVAPKVAPTAAIVASPRATPPNLAKSPSAIAKNAPQTQSAGHTTSVALEARTPPLQAAQARVQKPGQAFHVGAGVNIPKTTLSLAPTEMKTIPAKPVVTQVSPVMSPTIDTSTTTDLLRARELAKQSMQWRQDNTEIPTLDTTQTIRTLTKNELEDANRPKWFTVQLAISDHPANLDTMPRLDIFDAYSLYSVAVMEGTGIRHALRLGFFREEVSAQAVMGYLKTFFNDPIITRIPDAEHDRFVDAPKLSSLAKPATSVLTLEEKKPVRPMPIAATVPTVNTSVERTAAMSQPARNMPQPKPMARSASPAVAVKRSGQDAALTSARKSANGAKQPARTAQRDLIDEARALGLSDTQILRVEKNPSLLSRLLGK